MLERIFSVLLVSSSKNFSNGITHALSSDIYDVSVIDTVQKAKRIVIEKSYDIIIINCPLIDDFGTDFAIDVATKDISGVLMFVKPELESEVYYKTYEYGILTLTKPTSEGILLQSIRLLTSTLVKKEALIQKPQDFRSKLEDIKIVNKAKMLLIEHKHISEDDAHRYIEKRAMDLRKSKVKIANEIIDEYYKRGS